MNSEPEFIDSSCEAGEEDDLLLNVDETTKLCGNTAHHGGDIAHPSGNIVHPSGNKQQQQQMHDKLVITTAGKSWAYSRPS